MTPIHELTIMVTDKKTMYPKTVMVVSGTEDLSDAGLRARIFREAGVDVRLKGFNPDGYTFKILTRRNIEAL